MEKVKLYLVAVIYTFIVGFSFYGIKMCIPYGDTLTLLSYRYLAALAGVFIWLLVLKLLKMSPEKPLGRPKKNLYLSASFYVLFMIFQIIALYYTTSIEGAIACAFCPIFSKIIARVFLHEKATILQYFFVTLTISSVLIMIVLNASDTRMSLPGILLMLLSALCMSISVVFSRYIRGVFKPIEITTHIVIIGVFVFNLANIIRHIIYGTLNEIFEPLMHPQFLIWVTFLGIGCILLSAQFINYMLSRMQILPATIWGNASTVVTITVGVLLLGEPLHPYLIICAILALTGVVGLALAPAPEVNDGVSLKDKEKA